MTACAIIVAGGQAERFGATSGKQLAVVGGRTVLGLDAASHVSHLVVVCHPQRIEEYTRLAVDPSVTRTPFTVVGGGSTRQESVANGLAAVPAPYDFIAVHDGARPLVTSALIDGSIAELQRLPEAAGVVVGHPSYDTLKLTEDTRVLETPDRCRYWVAQTPQVFRAAVLRKAYSAAAETGLTGTDDASLVEAIGGPVYLYEGPRENIKVTVPGDLAFVAAVLGMRGEA
jgi:2-C-methyl-D-erythritol 4-phosphate cytidylyltransferase